MTYINSALTNRRDDLPPELAGFSEFNAAIVAFRFVRKRREEVSMDRWVEAAKWAAAKAAPGASEGPERQVKLTDVLDRLGLSKKAPL